MTIYVVTFELNDTYYVMGVFSTAELAQTYIDARRKKEYFSYESFTLDDEGE
jgi:hypothetical protein